MLTTSYWPADTSVPVLELTVGETLREAAAQMPDQVARALLARFRPGERVAVWAPNLPEWVFLEFGAAMAGVTLVTVNPAFCPRELEYVLKQSGASGVFLLPEYRGNQMAASLAQVRLQLPGLREVI